MPICSKCHRPLTDPYSIAVGMGPECRGGAAKRGWKFPKAKWKVRGGRAVFCGLAGKVEPPTAHVEKMNEKEALVRRALQHGEGSSGAARLLHDYMHEKDSPVTYAWCEKFVARVIGKINQEVKK